MIITITHRIMHVKLYDYWLMDNWNSLLWGIYESSKGWLVVLIINKYNCRKFVCNICLFIYPKVIGTTNWCIFNCQIMLKFYQHHYVVCRMLCVGVSPKGEHQYTLIVIWMNYMYDMCFMFQNAYVNFIMQYTFPIHWTLMYHICQFLMGLTFLTRVRKSNFISMF